MESGNKLCHKNIWLKGLKYGHHIAELFYQFGHSFNDTLTVAQFR